MSSQVTGLAPEDGSSGEFGANEWLVDEMYERYLKDKNSVDASWWPILEQYKPDAAATPIAKPATIEPDAAPASSPITGASPTTGSTPIARTTSLQARPQPIPAEAPTTASVPLQQAVDPAEAILDYARTNYVDHIVLGARTNSTLRNILGSVSAVVASKAPCTVTVVRPPRQFQSTSEAE